MLQVRAGLMAPTRRLAVHTLSAAQAAAVEQMLATCWRSSNRQAEPVVLGALRLGHAPRPCSRVSWNGSAPHGPGLRNLLADARSSGASRAAAGALHCCLRRHARQPRGPLFQAGASNCGALSLPRPPLITPQPRGMATGATTEDKLLLALADASDRGSTAEVSRLLDAGAPVNGMWPTAVSAVRDELQVVPRRNDQKSCCCEAWSRNEGRREQEQVHMLEAQSPPQWSWPSKYIRPRCAALADIVIDRQRFALGWRCASSQDGKTPLLRASEHGHVDTMRLLLDRGASVDAADRVSQPTHLAAPLSSLREASGSVPQRIGCGWARWPAGWVVVAAWL